MNAAAFPCISHGLESRECGTAYAAMTGIGRFFLRLMREAVTRATAQYLFSLYCVGSVNALNKYAFIIRMRI